MEIEYYQKYNELKKENHIFSYTGSLTFNNVILLKELIEKILVIQSAENKQKRRVINILIEALQNSHLHGVPNFEDNAQPGHDCFLLLGKETHTYFIVLGNFIKKQSVAVLQAKLESLLLMDIAELRELYLHTLDKGEITEKGGASLGLLRMFLDSSKNSSYKFYHVDQDYSFFSLELKISVK